MTTHRRRRRPATSPGATRTRQALLAALALATASACDYYAYHLLPPEEQAAPDGGGIVDDFDGGALDAGDADGGAVDAGPVDGGKIDCSGCALDERCDDTRGKCVPAAAWTVAVNTEAQGLAPKERSFVVDARGVHVAYGLSGGDVWYARFSGAAWQARRKLTLSPARALKQVALAAGEGNVLLLAGLESGTGVFKGILDIDRTTNVSLVGVHTTAQLTDDLQVLSDSAGTGHLAFRAFDTGGTNAQVLLRPMSSAWLGDLASAALRTDDLRLALAPDGTPHLLVWLAYQLQFGQVNGTRVDFAPLAGIEGNGASLAVTADTEFVAYYTAAPRELRVAQRRRGSGTWTIEKVADDQGESTAVVVDSQGAPHIVAAGSYGRLRHWHRHGTEWREESPPAELVPGACSRPSVRVDAEGTLHVIVHLSQGQGTFAYARFGR